MKTQTYNVVEGSYNLEELATCMEAIFIRTNSRYNDYIVLLSFRVWVWFSLIAVLCIVSL